MKKAFLQVIATGPDGFWFDHVFGNAVSDNSAPALKEFLKDVIESTPKHLATTGEYNMKIYGWFENEPHGLVHEVHTDLIGINGLTDHALEKDKARRHAFMAKHKGK